MNSLRRHEMLGLVLVFFGATCIGIGLYVTVYMALGKFLGDYMIRGTDYLLFPLFYGLGALLWSLGKIELKDVMPGRR